MIISKSFFFYFILQICYYNAHAQEVYDLWPDNEIPHYKENDLIENEQNLWGTTCLADVTHPTLTVFKPQGRVTSKAVIVIPGGGYNIVAIHHEGYEVAKALANAGITAAVLKYRLPNPKSSDKPELVPLSDARKALKLFRTLSSKYGFSDSEVGMVGFSAGGHLTTVASLMKSENPRENPDFSASVYGVTILSEVNLKWLEESLYFRPLTSKEKRKNTLLDLVDEDSPPTFLVHAYDDEVCKVEESTLYAEKLVANKVKVEMHLFPEGGHGFGLGHQENGTSQWMDLFINWIKNNDFH
jgi:acetyl esterase/lipase